MKLRIHALRYFRLSVKQIAIKYGPPRSTNLGKGMYNVTPIKDGFGTIK